VNTSQPLVAGSQAFYNYHHGTNKYWLTQYGFIQPVSADDHVAVYLNEPKFGKFLPIKGFED
jgi:hypothetical protein